MSARADSLAAANPGFEAYSTCSHHGDYQFCVNIVALVLQAFVTSRVVKVIGGLRGALLALPLIALGGYSLIAAGAGFYVVRWVKTTENATDY